MVHPQHPLVADHILGRLPSSVHCEIIRTADPGLAQRVAEIEREPRRLRRLRVEEAIEVVRHLSGTALAAVAKNERRASVRAAINAAPNMAEPWDWTAPQARRHHTQRILAGPLEAALAELAAYPLRIAWDVVARWALDLDPQHKSVVYPLLLAQPRPPAAVVAEVVAGEAPGLDDRDLPDTSTFDLGEVLAEWKGPLTTSLARVVSTYRALPHRARLPLPVLPEAAAVIVAGPNTDAVEHLVAADESLTDDQLSAVFVVESRRAQLIRAITTPRALEAACRTGHLDSLEPDTARRLAALADGLTLEARAALFVAHDAKGRRDWLMTGTPELRSGEPQAFAEALVASRGPFHALAARWDLAPIRKPSAAYREFQHHLVRHCIRPARLLTRDLEDVTDTFVAVLTDALGDDGQRWSTFCGLLHGWEGNLDDLLGTVDALLTPTAGAAPNQG